MTIQTPLPGNDHRARTSLVNGVSFAVRNVSDKARKDGTLLKAIATGTTIMVFLGMGLMLAEVSEEEPAAWHTENIALSGELINGRWSFTWPYDGRLDFSGNPDFNRTDTCYVIAWGFTAYMNRTFAHIELRQGDGTSTSWAFDTAGPRTIYLTGERSYWTAKDGTVHDYSARGTYALADAWVAGGWSLQEGIRDYYFEWANLEALTWVPNTIIIPEFPAGMVLVIPAIICAFVLYHRRSLTRTP